MTHTDTSKSDQVAKVKVFGKLLFCSRVYMKIVLEVKVLHSY